MHFHSRDLDPNPGEGTKIPKPYGVAKKKKKKIADIFKRLPRFKLAATIESSLGVVIVQSLSHVQFCHPKDCSMPGFPVLHRLLEFAQTYVCTESMMLSDHFILCCPLLLLPSIFPNIFSSELVLHIWWPKYWSFSFSISSSNDYSELISFRAGWFDLSTIQGTAKSLLQHHNSKASILQHSAFFMVQLSHLYMTTWKTIASTIWTFVSKVMSLLLNMLSRFVMAFLTRSKHLLISWLQSPSKVILEPKKIKSVSVSLFPLLFAIKMGLDAMIFVF